MYDVVLRTTGERRREYPSVPEFALLGAVAARDDGAAHSVGGELPEDDEAAFDVLMNIACRSVGPQSGPSNVLYALNPRSGWNIEARMPASAFPILPCGDGAHSAVIEVPDSLRSTWITGLFASCTGGSSLSGVGPSGVASERDRDCRSARTRRSSYNSRASRTSPSSRLAFAKIRAVLD